MTGLQWCLGRIALLLDSKQQMNLENNVTLAKIMHHVLVGRYSERNIRSCIMGGQNCLPLILGFPHHGKSVLMLGDTLTQLLLRTFSQRKFYPDFLFLSEETYSLWLSSLYYADSSPR